MVTNGQYSSSPNIAGHFETKFSYLAQFFLSNIIFPCFIYILRHVAAKDRFSGIWRKFIVSPGPDGYFETKHDCLAHFLLSKIINFVLCSLWPWKSSNGHKRPRIIYPKLRRSFWDQTWLSSSYFTIKKMFFVFAASGRKKTSNGHKWPIII